MVTMTLTIVIIGAVTSVLVAALIASAISVRPATPCMFDSSVVVLLGTYRYAGDKCTGKPDNIYLARPDGPTAPLNGKRVCNGHVKELLDLADQLQKQP